MSSFLFVRIYCTRSNMQHCIESKEMKAMSASQVVFFHSGKALSSPSNHLENQPNHEETFFFGKLLSLFFLHFSALQSLFSSCSHYLLPWLDMVSST